jgi:UDP:flavonoid glycosyltransferase YjiC (YdhE family)
VSHAGSGTTLASAGLGLPHLCLPQGADQFLNADAIAAAGAGLSLSPSDMTTDLIRTSVERLLADPSFRTAAARVAADISAMPEPTLVASALEDLTESPAWRT